MKKQYYDTHAADDQEEDDVYSGPSKSQRKRDCDALQALGQELTTLSADQLERIDLPEDILAAIAEFKRLRSFGAQRRQLQLLGKLMRQLDGPSVREAIDRATGESRAAVAALHRAERARDAMLNGDEAVTKYIDAHPEVDVQKLRQLVRTARKEKEAGKPPKSARELYRLIYSIELPPVDIYPREEDDEE